LANNFVDHEAEVELPDASNILQYAHKVLLEASPSRELERQMKEEIRQILSNPQGADDMVTQIFDVTRKFPLMLLRQEQFSCFQANEDMPLKR
jgi:hypothetical protein